MDGLEGFEPHDGLTLRSFNGIGETMVSSEKRNDDPSKTTF